MRNNFARGALALVLLPIAAWASPSVQWSGQKTQGALLVGQTEPGVEVALNGKPVRVHSDGRFVVGFGHDAPLDHTVELRDPKTGAAVRESLRLTARQYDIQRIDGLPQAQVTPPPETLERIQRDQQAVARARATDNPVPLFLLTGWVWPAEGRISGVYGSQRILNGQPRQPHFGIDIAAPKGAPVVATTDGVVTMAEDLYFTGNTIIIDHGFGITATYSHLETMTVKPGETVRQGQRIGTVGSTGRSTGPHLDWRVNWFDVRVDPLLVLPEKGVSN